MSAHAELLWYKTICYFLPFGSTPKSSSFPNPPDCPSLLLISPNPHHSSSSPPQCSSFTLSPPYSTPNPNHYSSMLLIRPQSSFTSNPPLNLPHLTPPLSAAGMEVHNHVLIAMGTQNTLQGQPFGLTMAERVGRGTPCLLWSLGVREVVGSRPGGAMVRRVFHPTRKLVRFSLLKCPSIPNSKNFWNT